MNKSVYFKWLRQLVDCDDAVYGDLMVYLFNKQFYWTTAMDENRAEDGKALRDLYSERHPKADLSKFREDTCSVLEMMIALARRWQVDLVSDDGSEDGFADNFWAMIRNLGLDIYMNSSFSLSEVDEKVNFMLDRSYSSDGVGGIFPLKTGKNDQKKSELWYQLQAYLSENGNF